jgi:DcmR-like sensory protein
VASTDALLGSAKPGTHLLQFYAADPGQLAKNVGKYFADGFDTGCTAVLVTTPEHRDAIFDVLAARDWSADVLTREGLLEVFDASQTLPKIMVDGWPDAERFDAVIGGAIRKANGRSSGAGTRAFGEMVGLLWGRGQFPAAIRLELLWNRLLERTRFCLFCAYPVDILGIDFEAGIVDPLLCAHTHVISNDDEVRLQTAIDHAMREVLDGSERRQAVSARGRRAWAMLPTAESTILWLRRNAPDRAEDIVARARLYFDGAP